MKAFADLLVFVRAVELGSLSAAARALELTPASASVALKRLEAELGVQLVARSTRNLRATSEGERFLRACREALRVMDEAEDVLRGDGAELRGRLTLSAPSDLGRNLLAGWLDAFLAEHPRLQLRMDVSDRMADVYRQPFDLAIRYGTPPDSQLVAVPLLANCRRVLCASPAYLARRGAPATPEALANHDCLRFVVRDGIHQRWTFQSPTGDAVAMQVRGDRVSEDGDLVRRWALAGHGIAYKSWPDVAHDVAEGRLVVLCPDWIGEHAPLNLVCADRRLVNPRVRRLRDFLRARCAELPVMPGV